MGDRQLVSAFDPLQTFRFHRCRWMVVSRSDFRDLTGMMEVGMADRPVRWIRILLPLLGVAIGIGGAALGLSKGLVVWLILAACALTLVSEYLWLRAKEHADS